MGRRQRRETHEANVQRALARNAELENAYVLFTAEHGREPSHRELWEISPPREAVS